MSVLVILYATLDKASLLLHTIKRRGKSLVTPFARKVCDMSSHSLMCTAQTVSNVSRLCTNSSWQNYPKTLCFPPIDETFSLFVGTWSAINSLLGLMGNGLTLLAIPYASKRKK